MNTAFVLMANTTADSYGQAVDSVYATREAADAARKRLYYGGRVVEVPSR